MKGFDSVQMLTTVCMYVCMYVYSAPWTSYSLGPPCSGRGGGYSVTLAYHCSFVDFD